MIYSVMKLLLLNHIQYLHVIFIVVSRGRYLLQMILKQNVIFKLCYLLVGNKFMLALEKRQQFDTLNRLVVCYQV